MDRSDGRLAEQGLEPGQRLLLQQLRAAEPRGGRNKIQARRQQTEHSGGIKPLGPQVRQTSAALALGQALTRPIPPQGGMPVAGQAAAMGPQVTHHSHLRPRGSPEISAAHNIGHPQAQLIHRRRQVIGEKAIRAPQHHIAHLPLQIKNTAGHELLLPANKARIHRQSPARQASGFRPPAWFQAPAQTRVNR